MDKSRKILPVGISDFRKIIEEQYYFVDKSLLIKEIINSGAEVTLLTRPRRFGKTLNMNMIKLFFVKILRKRRQVCSRDLKYGIVRIRKNTGVSRENIR